MNLILRWFFTSERKFNVPNLTLSILLLLAGLAYFLFLYGIFPRLVPFHGGSEKFRLGEANNFTFQMSWSAFSRLHLTLQANDTVKLYRDGNYVCVCSYYAFAIESGYEASILLKSTSSVNGVFTARQEIPLEKQLLAFTMLIAGLFGLTRASKTGSF